MDSKIKLIGYFKLASVQHYLVIDPDKRIVTHHRRATGGTIAARAIGLDCGPMSGFDNEGIDREFFSGARVKSNFICAIGYGDPSAVFERLPRPSFSEVCEIV